MKKTTCFKLGVETFAVLAVSAMMSVCVADVSTNSWIGADGAAWGTPGNWSLGHVPDGSCLRVRSLYLSDN